MNNKKLRAGEMALVGMFAALMGIGANITSFPFFLKEAQALFYPIFLPHMPRAGSRTNYPNRKQATFSQPH